MLVCSEFHPMKLLVQGVYELYSLSKGLSSIIPGPLLFYSTYPPPPPPPPSHPYFILSLNFKKEKY